MFYITHLWALVILAKKNSFSWLLHLYSWIICGRLLQYCLKSTCFRREDYDGIVIDEKIVMKYTRHHFFKCFDVPWSDVNFHFLFLDSMEAYNHSSTSMFLIDWLLKLNDLFWRSQILFCVHKRIFYLIMFFRFLPYSLLHITISRIIMLYLLKVIIEYY